MARLAICAVIALAAMCCADNVGQGRVGVLGRGLRGAYGLGGGHKGAGLRGAADGHQGVSGLGSVGGHQHKVAGHGPGVGISGDGFRFAHGHGRRISRLSGLKSISGGRGQIGVQNADWAHQRSGFSVGKSGSNVRLDAEKQNPGLDHVIDNVRQGKGGRFPRDVLSQDDIQGGVAQIVAGAQSGKAGVPQIVGAGLGLGQALGKSVGTGNIHLPGHIGPGGPGILKNGAGLGPATGDGGWNNRDGRRDRYSGMHDGIVGGLGTWNYGRGLSAGSGIVNLAPHRLEGSWDNTRGDIGVNPEVHVLGSGSSGQRVNSQWRDIGNDNIDWVEAVQNQDAAQNQEGGQNQETGQNDGAKESKDTVGQKS